MQLDKFYVQEWGFEELNPDESPPDWIKLVNVTIEEKGIQFYISPSLDKIGKSYAI